MSGEGIEKEDCRECKKYLQEQLDGHSEEIVDIRILLTKIVTLQEEVIKANEKSDVRLREIEAEQMKHRGAFEERKLHKEQKKSESDETEPWWREKWFSIIIITACVLVVLVTGAAIGQNVLADYVNIIKQ